ncbi:MAG: teicoplanin resistance protein VanZ [Myxococcales bacterium]|nr:teicoplanin resistance protein VanZ [Myxococcales bacterium]
MRSGSAPKVSPARWALPVSYMGLIWYLSSQPISALNVGFRVSDKVLHCLAFGALALFVWWAGKGLRRPALIAFVVAALYGGVDELHQLWGDAGRIGDVWDWLADVLGAGLMATFLHHWSRRVETDSTALPPTDEEGREAAG